MLNVLFTTVAITFIPVFLYIKKYTTKKQTNIFYSDDENYINIWSDDDYFTNSLSESDNEFDLSKTSEFSDIDDL